MKRAIFILLIVCAALVPAARAQSSAQAERVHLAQTEGGCTVQVNASAPVSPAQLRGQPVTQDGVTIAFEGDRLKLSATRRPVVFETGNLSGELPAGNDLSVTLENGHAYVFETPARNTQPALLAFPDSGKAGLPPEAHCRAEFLEDGVYSVVGSGNVTATSADGIQSKFTRHSGPMLGGRLREQTDARGTKRFSRATPVGLVNLSGKLDSEIRVGSLEVSIEPGQERMLSFPNGARVLLKRGGGPEVEWRVVRGVAHFTIAGFSCWKASASGGQSGSLLWNAEKRAVDLKHFGGSSGYLIAQLSGRVTASVAAGSTFQYAQFQDCGSFAASAIGDVMLLDRDTGENLPVHQTSVSYNEGVRAGGDRAAAGRPFLPVSLVWDSDARIQLRGGSAVYPVGVGTEQTLTFGEESLSAAYRNNGSVLLRSVEGNFTLEPEFIPEISIDIPEGGAVVLRLNRQRLVFTAESAPDSAADLRVVSGGRTYMYLTGQGRITVVLGQNSILPEGNASWIFFEGAGGDGSTAFRSTVQPGLVVSPDGVSVDRIFQPPVSILE